MKSLLHLIRSLFSQYPLYVRIQPNRLRIREVTTGREYTDEPIVAIDANSKVLAFGRKARLIAQNTEGSRILNGFDHPRSIIDDFFAAEKALQTGVRELNRDTYFRPAPLMVVHPLGDFEGGLTVVERRALLELAVGAGARKVVVWDGAELTDEDVQSHDIMKLFET